MVTFDLQPLLFVLIVLLALVAGGAIWLDRRLHRGQVRDRSDWPVPALDEAPFGVLSLDEAGELACANPAARRLLGLDASATALPEAEWADRLLSDVEAIRSDGAATGRYRIVPAPPDRLVRWWAMGGGELVFLFDATEQQRADQAARQLLNDLSHELRTPLATILTHVEVLGLANLPDATRAESLRLLKDETQRTVRLVNAMLELGRLETSGEPALRPVDALAVAEAALHQSMPNAEARSIHLSLEADTPLPAVLAEADQLMRVFLNLLDNAIKFSRAGDQVVVLLVREAPGVRCAVRDNGPGIAGQHLPFVTRRFYRAAPPEQAGSGLGLAMVEEILRRHGCALHITSSTAEGSSGTLLSFVLPAARAEEALQ
jgi:two-component system phosphate regulon sensor histidine kinase PhoR